MTQSELFEFPEIPKKLVDEFRILKKNITKLNGTRFTIVTSFLLLNKIYTYLDSYNQFVSTFSVCKKGCSHCCKNSIHLTALEAEYICQNAEIEPNSIPIKKENNKAFCPFLNKSDQCDIYEFRPFNCRTLHALDHPKYCLTGEDHMLYGASGYGYGVTVYEQLAIIIQQINKHNKNDDIRSFFSTI